MTRRTLLQTLPAAAAVPAGPKLRAALYGVTHGHVNGKLKAMLDSGDWDVVSACEPDADVRKLRAGADLFRGIRWVEEEELLADKSIDVVVVECPVWDAIAYGRRVIAAGRHLHLEKPPSDRLEPFRELLEEARRKKLLLQMGYIWRFHEGFRRIKQAMEAGWLGHVYQIRGTINTDLAPAARSPLARYAGGMMLELGCHQIDRVVDLWGRPTAVRSWLRHETGIADTLADHTLAVFEYPAGLAIVTSSARMAGSSQHRSFEVIGTNGSMMIQPVEPGTRMRVVMREPRGPYKAGWQDVALPPQPRYVGDAADLARALRSKGPLEYSYDYELLLQETVVRACGG